MESSVFIEAVKTLGAPIAIAAFLIWHFVQLNRSLQSHNARLANEVARLRAQFEAMIQADTHGERLLQQNEALSRIVEAKDRDSQVLLRLLVEAQIGKPGDTRLLERETA